VSFSGGLSYVESAFPGSWSDLGTGVSFFFFLIPSDYSVTVESSSLDFDDFPLFFD